ncbi:DnaB-like helicase C-terminal domain-containing protein [Bacillus sp. AK128]
MSIAEKTFLGSLMKANYLIKDTVIRPEQLEGAIHQQLMYTMIQLIEDGKSADLITITTLTDFNAYGGVSYLAEVLSYADIEKFEVLEETLIEVWKEREKNNILKIAAVNDWEISRVIAELDKINQLRINDHSSIEQVLSAIYSAPWEDQEEVKNAPTGIEKLDDITGGFQDGEVIVVAARPSMGKTDVMLHFAKSTGWAGDVPIIFSLEMPER